jgi:hypothetical protein
VSIPCAADVRPLAPSQRGVLALSLVLRRDPALVRGRGGAALVSYRSWDAVPAGPLVNDAGVAKPVTVGVPGRAPETTVAANQVRVSPDAAQPAPRTGDSSLDPGHPAAAGDAAEVARPRIVDDPIPDVPAVRESAETDQHVAPVAGRAPAPATLALAPDVVESDFAGVVYLVNLALYLQLYTDFTRPLGASLDLPLGDFLAVIGERACGGRFTRDPVWAVLACLSGRDPEERPARDFAPPDDQDFESWRSDLAERLERRAAEALGALPGPALPFLCARSGRLSLSATRLDVAFPLADHPVAIRLAGLDRTPGWVPAAGRVIELHYE